MRALSLLLSLVLVSAPAQKRKAAPAKAPAVPQPTLSVDFIMRGPNLYGHEPRDVRWAGDNERIFFRWKKWDEPVLKEFDLYVASRSGGPPRKLADDEARQAPPARGDFDAGQKRKVYVQDGDLWIYDFTTDKARRLTRTGDAEGNPRWTRDGQRIAFTRNNNLYVLSLADATLVQLTDLRTGPAPDPPDKKGTDSQEFIKKEEQDLLDIVKRRAAVKKEEEERKKRENPRKAFYLTAKQRVLDLMLTPDEKFVVARLTENADGAKRAGVPNYITQDVYSEQIPTRTKVGDKQENPRVAIFDAATGAQKWLDTGLKERAIGFFDAPWFNEAGTQAIFMARAADNKDRWIFSLDVAEAKAKVLFTEHDDAWVNIYGLFSYGWLKGGDAIFFTSEKTGYNHLYTLALAGGEPKALTEGKWEVLDAALSRDKSKFYITSNEEHFGEQHYYSLPVSGGPRTKLTSGAGKHEVVLSPDERHQADIWSYMNRPPELYADARPLTDSPAPEFKAHRWLEPALVTFKARDGAEVPARVYKPANWAKGGPAVIFVHGAGYLQNAHRWWSSYAREYMFHHLLVELGYMVLDADYRASAGLGRDWRTGIYRYMGGKDLDDQLDAAKWLVSEHGVDPKRLGVYGGSYGGFITLMALFTQPDVFAAGAALRPVTDWAQYNHPYTSNILNEPQKDPEAYRKSSPIYFAQNLKSALLICHGMVDLNVHFQDSVRLAQRLIELRKENWELAVYPIEDHGFVEPTSWADEYKRILKLFETNLKKPAN